MSEHGHCQAYQQQAHQEELLAPGHGYKMKQPGHQPLRSHPDEKHDAACFKHQYKQVMPDISRSSPQHRGKEQERNKYYILKDQYPHYCFSVMGGQLGSLLQQFHHYRGAAEGGEEAHKE